MLEPTTLSHLYTHVHWPYITLLFSSRCLQSSASFLTFTCCCSQHQPKASSDSRMSEPEPPFRPREKLIEKQKYFQSIYRPTYLKGPYDKITSVAIPLALAATAMFMTARGIYNMAHGIGKKDML